MWILALIEHFPTRVGLWPKPADSPPAQSIAA
jgi:hypothetical protein